MGQSVVDLPDPLENPKLGQTPSADDLLAQLAGDEIDRLLAESDGEKPADAPPAFAASADPAVAPEPTVGSSEIETVLAEAETKTGARKTSAGEDESTSKSVSAAPVREDSADVEVAVAERSALNDTGLNDSGESHAGENGVGEELGSLQMADLPAMRVRLPLVLRPLEWVNTPLNYCSEETRESVGKVAIVTLLNALAVLAYVWVIRRHH